MEGAAIGAGATSAASRAGKKLPPLVWAPRLAEPRPRKLCTDCGLSRMRIAKACGRACQFIAPDYPHLEAEVHGRARDPERPDELHFGPFRRMPEMPARLRVVPGLYFHRLTEEAKQSFFEDTWKVAPEADRIGYRFRGGRPSTFVPREQPFGAGSDPSNIVDAAYPYGSIQVPGGTEPIALHRDAVSSGGYMMLGTVISADMDLIGQLQPHTPTRFVPCDMAEALRARAYRRKLLHAIRAHLAA